MSLKRPQLLKHYKAQVRQAFVSVCQQPGQQPGLSDMQDAFLSLRNFL
jgi:hypothetical protein